MTKTIRHIACRTAATAILAIIACVSAAAQSTDPPTVGDCEPGDAEAFLDVGNVRAKILNTGSLFWNGGQNVYEVPKGSGNNSHFAMTFMMAGLVDDSIRIAASSYGRNLAEFWPGPIPGDGRPPTDCDRFDRIWEVRSTGPRHPVPATGVTGDVNDWPVHLGAPFFDAGDSAETYDPEEGDRPELLGDQMLWWIMNDRGNAHPFTQEQPLGIEVRVVAFAFGTLSALGNQTFYRYRIRNRSDRPIRAAYVGFFNDVDVGAAFDDRIGSDSSSGLAYFYNGDDDDDGNYGAAPPAVGFTAIRRPESTIDVDAPDCSYPDGRQTGLTNHMGINSGPHPTGDRISGSGEPLYGTMRSIWLDGTPLTIGGNGYAPDSGATQTNFMFTGDPATGSFWSELNLDGSGTAVQSADRRSVFSVGPFCLGPGDETEAAFAVLWARGESNLDSVTKLRALGMGVVEVGDDLLRPRQIESSASPGPEAVQFSAGIHPNPASSRTTLRVGLPREMHTRIEIFDALGRPVTDVVDARLEAGEKRFDLSVAAWPPGVYLVRMHLDHITETRTLVVNR